MAVTYDPREAAAALRLLERVPSLPPWAPGYFLNAPEPPSRPISSLPLSELASLLDAARAGSVARQRVGSPWPRDALVSELTRRASGNNNSAAASRTAGVLNDLESMPTPDWATTPGTPAAGRIEGGEPAAPLSRAAHPPAAARARAPTGTAVATPSAGSGVAAAPPAPLQPPASAPPSKRTPPLEAEPGQRMMEFGLAMLNSRSPRFGQTVGEAGQAVITSDRARRSENREQQKADTEQQFREAYIRVQESEQRLQADPNSAANRLKYAHERAALAGIISERMRAGAAITTAANAGRDRVTHRAVDDQGNMWNIYESGRRALMGDATTRFRDTSNTPPARTYTNWYNNRATASTRIAVAQPPDNLIDPAAIRAWRLSAWNDWMTQNPEPPNPDAPRTAPAANNVTESQYVPPPLRR